MATVVVKGADEAQKLLRSLSGRELQNRTRRGTRAGAAVFRTAVRAAARSRSDLPDSFARTATRGHRSPVGTSTGPTSPLLNIFEGGAGAHEIGGAGQVLVNREADFFARGPVHHPGMDARPLIGPVFDDKEDEATEAAMATIMAGIR